MRSINLHKRRGRLMAPNRRAGSGRTDRRPSSNIPSARRSLGALWYDFPSAVLSSSTPRVLTLHPPPQTAVIRSKRGLITGCDIALKDSTLALEFAPLDELLRDMRYGFVDVDEPADVVAHLTGNNEAGAGVRRTEVYAWLRAVMSER